ncbi:MAG TPA: mechanosensitive ion channel family protein [Bacteroidetes bacterium]|nr:mechanosensitive ion channel family protein [Bacteroidota bacterium]
MPGFYRPGKLEKAAAQLMDSILQNEYALYTLTLLFGLAFGQFIVRPVFLLIKKKSEKKQFRYFCTLLGSLVRVSPFIGAVASLNILRFQKTIEITSENLLKSAHVISIAILTYIAGELLVYIYDSYSRARTGKATSLYHILIRILTYSAGTIVIFDLLGIEIAPILTALGVGGLAVALALQDTLSNLFAGVHILAARQLKPGDYIRLDSGEEGYVVDINWRNTEIRTLLHNIVIIPNSKIASSVTTNFFTVQKNLFFHFIVGVHYDSDLEQVERVTLEVAQKLIDEYPHIPRNFSPRVQFLEFADSSINLRVWLATDLYENQYDIRHEFIKRLHKRYGEEGITIPFPIRSIYVEKNEN